MNRTQKTAWMNLIGSFMSVVMMGLLAYFLLSGATPEKVGFLKPTIIILSAFLALVFIYFLIFVLRKKQSITEPDADERDQLITKKAIQVAFVSVCILMFFATALPMWVYGLDSSLPTAVLPLINLCVFLTTLTIYNAAILVLYEIKGGVT